MFLKNSWKDKMTNKSCEANNYTNLKSINDTNTFDYSMQDIMTNKSCEAYN
jgi:hypothetical protein